MKKLVFGENLIWSFVANEEGKGETWRKYKPSSHDFKAGEYVLGKDKCGISVLLRVLEDTIIRDWDVTDEQARSHGYDSAEHLRTTFKEQFYPGLDFENDKLAIIKLEVAKIDIGEKVPMQVIQLNEYMPLD